MVHIRYGNIKSGGHAVHLRHAGAFGADDPFEFTYHIAHFLLADRGVPPVLRPGFIVNFANNFGFFVQIFQVQAAQGQPFGAAGAGHDFFKQRGKFIVARAVESQQIFDLTIPRPFYQFHIIRKIIRHHDGRHFIKAVHQQTVNMIGGWIGRTAHGADALGAEPLFPLLKQSAGNGRVIDAVKKAEKADIFLMIFIVNVIDQHAQPARRAPVFIGQQQPAPRMLPERIVRPQQFARIGLELTYPIRVVFIQLIRKINKRFDIVFRVFYGNLRHKPSKQ